MTTKVKVNVTGKKKNALENVSKAVNNMQNVLGQAFGYNAEQENQIEKEMYICSLCGNMQTRPMKQAENKNYVCQVCIDELKK